MKKIGIVGHTRMERGFIGSIMTLLAGLAPKWSGGGYCSQKIVFREDTPRILTDEQRIQRSLHRKKIRRAHRERIERRGWS